jgi:predicted O-methyltransferase YrrM
VWIYDALRRLGGGRFIGCEIEAERATATVQRLNATSPVPDGVSIEIVGDVLHYLRTTDDRLDLAWVDDCHEKPHVTKELTLLYPKINKGGLILLHDVHGSCDLRTVVQQFGGYSIDLPRMGPAGGLGLIQVAQ